jgi:hypothetical protein
MIHVVQPDPTVVGGTPYECGGFLEGRLAIVRCHSYVLELG